MLNYVKSGVTCSDFSWKTNYDNLIKFSRYLEIDNWSNRVNFALAKSKEKKINTNFFKQCARDYRNASES